MGTAILFDGVDDQMGYTGPPETVTNYSLLIVLKMLGADGTWQSFIEQETSGAAGRPSLGRNNASLEYLSDSTGISTVNTIGASDGWMILCATKATGTVAPQLHKIVIGGSRTSAAGGANLGNQAAYPGGILRIGGNDDFANIEVACAATWVGTILSTTQLDGVNTAKTSQSILDLAPSWMVDASDGLVNDRSGGSVNRTSVTGTTAGSSDPSGWVYLGGAAATLPLLVMSPPPQKGR